jgi:hypothetical protein
MSEPMLQGKSYHIPNSPVEASDPSHGAVRRMIERSVVLVVRWRIRRLPSRWG